MTENKNKENNRDYYNNNDEDVTCFNRCLGFFSFTSSRQKPDGGGKRRREEEASTAAVDHGGGKMGSVNLEENLRVRVEVVKKACSLSLKAHKPPGKQLFVTEKLRSSEVIFGFPGSWNASDWISKAPFGEVEVDLQLFPSILYIGLREIGAVNEAFLRRFKALLASPQFVAEVEKARRESKQVIFTGHSAGGPTAILATLWFLEKYKNASSPILPLCLTFGSPLVGDRFLNHAVNRENWSKQFIHFVMRYDIVPRISLSQLQPNHQQQQLQDALKFFNPNIKDQLPPEFDPQSFFVHVMRGSSSVASHAACKIMGNTNLLLETVSSFVELSPYRPFGTFVFAAGNGKLVILRNPDAVLQVLFYSSQLSSPDEVDEIAKRSLKDHLNYANELKECLDNMQSVTSLDDHRDSLASIPLSSDSATAETAAINASLNDLGLSVRARLCLRAAAELEKQKGRNQDTINDKMKDIEAKIQKLENYKNKCTVQKRTYYRAFRLSEEKSDFEANVTRLELAGIWDEIVEMLKRYELPDDFEGKQDWIELGTRFRLIAEPLDISNYYRHAKNEDTGTYMVRGRPKRYKCTQRWKEQVEGRAWSDDPPESCFWAEVEELLIAPAGSPATVEKVRGLQRKVDEYKMGAEVYLEDSLFVTLLKQNNLR
ncbi:unnamed protein product [Linum trigynum]|uniref:Uncharacterized protein n=2 Tax=Linum trigynum TaxID=586398 RepID=A0AAV2D6D5_9ROSI